MMEKLCAEINHPMVRCVIEINATIIENQAMRVNISY